MAGRDRRRRAAALLVSLLIHTALLAPLLLVAPKFQTTQTPNPATMRLGLVPAPSLGITTHRTTPGRPAATSQRVRAQPLAQPASRPQDQLASRVSAPAASAPHTPPSAAAISASANTEAPPAAVNQDTVRRALRTALACAPSNTQNLDEETRAACRKRLSEAAAAIGDARVDTIPPEKRAYYDAVAKAYQDPTATPHPPGIGCALPFGIPKGWKPSRKKPPHSLKLGPLPCYIMPPKGFLTEEADIPPADEMPKN